MWKVIVYVGPILGTIWLMLKNSIKMCFSPSSKANYDLGQVGVIVWAKFVAT